MGKIVYVIGKSGTGKSTSIRTLDHKSTYIINVCNKDLPFKGSASKYRVKSEDHLGNLYATADYSTVIKMIKGIAETRPDIKTLIIDDFNYIITKQVFESVTQKGFDKFTMFAKSVQDIMQAIQNVRNDLYVFIMWHTELADDGTYKIKTIGKMIDNQITPEGLASIVLHTHIKDGKYKFITQNDGVHLAKSPMGMFDDFFIDNDINYVINSMNNYYKSLYDEDVPQ